MRRTRAEAEHTRAAILDAALACFGRHGIGGSTLEQVAAEAGVTKGAIYHHFRGKGHMLHEILREVSLPLLRDADTQLIRAGERPALERIEKFLLGIVETLATDGRAREALAAMNFKCEYVGGLERELAGSMRVADQLAAAFEAAYAEARREGTFAPGLSPRLAALDTLAFLGGLVRLWLLEGARGRIRRDARALVRSHVRTRRARPGARPPR